MTSTTPSVPQTHVSQRKAAPCRQASTLPRMKGSTPTEWNGRRERASQARRWSRMWVMPPESRFADVMIANLGPVGFTATPAEIAEMCLVAVSFWRALSFQWMFVAAHCRGLAFLVE